MPEPGWYEDPHNAGQLRRWENNQWTDEVRPKPTTASAESDRTSHRPTDDEPCVRVGLLGLEIKALSECGAVLETPQLGPERLKQARSGLRLRTAIALLILSFFLLESVLSIAVIYFMRDPMALIFLLFQVPFIVVPLIFIKRVRQPLTDAESGFLVTTSEAHGLPNGAMVTVTGIVEAGETSGVWGEPSCVWTTYRYSQGDNNEVYRSPGQVWLGDGRGGARIKADLSTATEDSIGDPSSVHPQAKAWALRIGDEISLTGRLAQASDGTLTIGSPPSNNPFKTEYVLLGHPSAPYAGDAERASQGGDLDAARSAFGGRPGPSLVILPPRTWPSVH